MTRNDHELLAASGCDPAAFRELYDRYARPVDAFFTRRTGDPDLALDLTAETFAQAWQHRHRFDDRHDGSCGPWLFGIARNLLLRAVRDRRLAFEASQRLRLTLRSTDVVVGPDWADGLDADLADALGELPDTQRRAVELRVLDDRSYDDLAARLDCSPGAARIRVSRGLGALRSILTTTEDHS